MIGSSGPRARQIEAEVRRSNIAELKIYVYSNIDSRSLQTLI